MFKMDGFDELQKELEQLSKSAKELEGEQSVPFSELFTHDFMSKYTTFHSLESLLSSGNFKAETDEEFDAIPENELDSHVSKTTDFDNWEDMLGTAVEEYAVKKLGL
ncbi:MAG: hypothetical protein RR595_05605 [Lysinibacillus sp.]